jgi:molybdate transport system substrate-binding protein
MIKRLWPAVLLAALVACGQGQAGGDPPATADPLLVAAASDLQLVFPEIGERFTAESGQPVVFTFGATGNLTTQIENGAPFDVLAAANVAFIDRLAEQDLILPGSRRLYGQGRIALVVNRASGLAVTRLEELLDPAITPIAIANPEHAPYGQAAREALQSAGVWDEVEPRLVLGENVAQAMQFVQSGDAPVGIVAASIAGAAEVASTALPAELHAPINQEMAVIKGTPREAAARAFVDFVNSPAGREILARHGFQSPGGP